MIITIVQQNEELNLQSLGFTLYNTLLKLQIPHWQAAVFYHML